MPETTKTISCHQSVNKDGLAVNKICIKDSGTGIPQGILKRLYDPFFTTKPDGKVPGLGLSISYGIIRDHGGIIKVDSRMHEYTKLLIELPIIGV